MGANPSKPGDSGESTNVPINNSTACPVSRNVEVDKSVENSSSLCPVKRTPQSAPKVESSMCPVKHKNQDSNQNQPYKNSSVFNVYSTKIDPTNQMPATANQKPAAGQEASLSVERAPSNIPKGGTDAETWTYPSPQMFWNALVRKDKTEGVSEQDMETVIAIHNNMNENTWNQVVEWEKLVNDPSKADPGRESKLLKFCGRPDELSPKARLKVLFGHPAPFDRHDWTIDRGGKEVRYIIDYYHDESAVQRDKTPQHMKDAASMQSIKVDVRPALDSPASILARMVLMPWRRLQGETGYNPPPFFAPKVMLQAEESKLERIKQDWRDIATKCLPKKEALAACTSEEACRAASVALQACTASVVCPSVAADFQTCTSLAASESASKEADLRKAGAAYSALVQCLELFEIDSLKAMGKESVDMKGKNEGSMNMEKWVENAKARMQQLKNSHHLQRIQLELAFETAPRDSRYSNGLIDMMRKEEQILAREQNSLVTKSVTQKVDECLRAETRGFFAKTVEKNIKKWVVMKEKFDKETSYLTKAIEDELRNNYNNIKGTKKNTCWEHSSRRVPTPEELDREAERLECDYNQNWYKYENFSLQEAFKSQNNRIENDWSTHEKALEEEFRTKREKIAGPSVAHSRSSLSNHHITHDPRWQHPEKQKTLIHTAPVLSPTRSQQTGASDSSAWVKGKDSAAIAMELERIEREYDAAVAGMQKQKGDAKRWLLRQQVRLQAQAVEVQQERAAVAEILAADYNQLLRLTQVLESVERQ